MAHVKLLKEDEEFDGIEAALQMVTHVINWEKARHGERDERWSMQRHLENIKTIIQSRNEK